jgi:hypothetical protein
MDAASIPGTARTGSERDLIRSDHRALRACAERLDGELARLAAGNGAAEATVRSLLEEFRGRLLRHLSAEEQSGILEQAANAEPRLARRAEELRLQHEDLRRSATQLAAGPGEGAVAVDWAGFWTRFVSFREVLERHEQAENDILQRAYLEDLGGGG